MSNFKMEDDDEFSTKKKTESFVYQNGALKEQPAIPIEEKKFSLYETEFIQIARGFIPLEEVTAEEFYEWFNSILPITQWVKNAEVIDPGSDWVKTLGKENLLKDLERIETRKSSFKTLVDLFRTRFLFVNKAPLKVDEKTRWKNSN